MTHTAAKMKSFPHPPLPWCARKPFERNCCALGLTAPLHSHHSNSELCRSNWVRHKVGRVFTERFQESESWLGKADSSVSGDGQSLCCGIRPFVGVWTTWKGDGYSLLAWVEHTFPERFSLAELLSLMFTSWLAPHSLTSEFFWCKHYIHIGFSFLYTEQERIKTRCWQEDPALRAWLKLKKHWLKQCGAGLALQRECHLYIKAFCWPTDALCCP